MKNSAMTCLLALLLAPSIATAQVTNPTTEIIDTTGDGTGNTFGWARGVAVDAGGNMFVAGQSTDNVFKITPGGTITEIIDATGDGAGNPLLSPFGVAVDAGGNVFVAGQYSDNAFKIATPGTCSTSGTPCTITEIIDATGDGAGNPLGGAFGIAADAGGNVFVAGYYNAFKIAAPGTCSTSGTPCTITEIIDTTGDGTGNPLDGALEITVDSAASNVFVGGYNSNNAFKIGGVAVPTLSEWGIIAMSLVMFGGVIYLRRRRAEGA